MNYLLDTLPLPPIANMLWTLAISMGTDKLPDI